MHISTDFIATRDGIIEVARAAKVRICLPDATELSRGVQLPRPRPARVPELFGVDVVRNPDDACRHCMGTGRYSESTGRLYGDATITIGPCPYCGGTGRK